MSGGPVAPAVAAEALGRRVIYPGSDELLIDIDSEEDMAKHKRLLSVLIEHKAISLAKEPTVRPSASGFKGRYHVTLVLDRPIRDHAERIMLQSLLGSDPMREVLSYVQLLQGEPAPCVFFEVLEEKKEMDS